MPLRAALDVPRSTFYSWYRRYQEEGVEGLKAKSSKTKQFWNRIPDPVREESADGSVKNFVYSLAPYQHLSWQRFWEKGLSCGGGQGEKRSDP